MAIERRFGLPNISTNNPRGITPRKIKIAIAFPIVLAVIAIIRIT